MPTLASLPRRSLLLLVRGYQIAISPALPPGCRFTPSCSQFALGRLERVKGIAVVPFTVADVVRHPLVGRIVDAYEGPQSLRDVGA